MLQSVAICFPQTERKECLFHFAQAVWRKVQSLGLQQHYQEDADFKQFVQSMIALAFVPPAFVRVALGGLQGDAPDFQHKDDLLHYFQQTWITGNFPTAMWNVFTLDGPRTNNNAEGWHSKIRKLAGKAHPNIYEAVSLFKAEQAATEVTLLQLAGGGLPKRRRRKYRQHEQRILTIKEKYEAGEYSTGT